jgi:hypothetical protein
MHDDNTPQQLGRTDSSIKRDEKWEAAFLAQLTHDLGEKVAAYAQKRARYIEAKTGSDDPNLARELYQDAVTDTWTGGVSEGGVSWDPNRCSLELHLKRVIRSRSSNQLKHLDQFPHFSISHQPSNQDDEEIAETSEPMSIELERSMSDAMESERAGNRGDLPSFVDEVIEALVLLASGDEEVLQILYCFGRGLSERRDVMHETGMSSTTYHNARRRMLRLVERLPQHIRDAAIDAMD